MRFLLPLFLLILVFPSAVVKAQLPENPTQEDCIEFYDEQMAISKHAEENYDEARILKLEEEGRLEEAHELGFKPYIPLFEIAFNSPQCAELDKRYYDTQKTFCAGYLTAGDNFRALMDNMKRPFPYCQEALDRGDEKIFIHFVAYYLKGIGGEKDYAAAIKFIDEFVENHPDKKDVVFLKAPIYQRGGYGIEKDVKKAFDIWKKINEQYPEQSGSACQLSLFYRDAIGTERNEQKAEEYLEIFKQNNPKGHCNHSSFDFLFEDSGLEKELLDNQE